MHKLLAGALVVAAGALPARASPVITEVAWMGDGTASHEWVELENPDAAVVDLSGFVLIQGTTVRPLPAQTLDAGAYLLLERTADTPLAAPAGVQFSFGTGLSNSGDALCLCPTGTSACGAGCDVANPGPAGTAWFAGDNTSTPKRTMERAAGNPDGTQASSWQNGDPSSPGAPSSAGPVDAGTPEPDAGSVEDAGTVVDAGSLDDDTAPVISLSQPAGTATDAVVSVVYSASDPDPGDAVSVDLFWSTAASGNAGVVFAQGLPGGTDASFDFDTTGLPAGTVHVFGRARDTRGKEAFAYAPGTVEIGGGGPAEVTFRLTKPDGVNDLQQDGSVAVTWDVALPAGVDGTIAIFDDTDGQGADGVPIAGALSAGPDGPRAFKWTEAPPGEHFVYGVLTYTGGTATSYAPASVTVDAPAGCSCTGQGPERGQGASGSLLAVGSLAILASRFGKRCATGSSPTSTATSRR